MAQGWRPGLLLGLAAFVAVLVAPVLPALNLAFAVLGVASTALLSGDARRRAPRAFRDASVGLALVAAGMLGLVLSAALASGSARAGEAPPGSAVWSGFAAEVAVAGGFYLAAVHLAGARSRILLGLAFGASLAVSAAVALSAAGPPERLQAALLAKPVPFILYAWAYATILDWLRAEARPKESWAP